MSVLLYIIPFSLRKLNVSANIRYWAFDTRKTPVKIFPSADKLIRENPETVVRITAETFRRINLTPRKDFDMKQHTDPIDYVFIVTPIILATIAVIWKYV